MKDKKKRKDKKNLDKEVSLAIGNEVERFGRASNEHFNANSPLKKNADRGNTIPQKAGFSAEIKEVSRTNAENIINRSPNRIARTDNVGAVNHTKYDTVDVDSKGNPLLDRNGDYVGGAQLKTSSNMEYYEQLYGEKYKNVKRLIVPKDQYGEVVNHFNSKIEKLQKIKESDLKNGKISSAERTQKEINDIENAKKRLCPAKTTYEDSIEAAEKPLSSTTKDIVRVSHKAGMGGAAYGAAVGGSISIFQNVVSACRGEKELDEAIEEVVKSTGKSAAIGYGTGFFTSAVGGALQNQKHILLKSLGKGARPMVILNAGVMLAKNIIKLAQGKLNSEEFILSMSQESTALASSIYGAGVGSAIGTTIMPGVGTVAGGIIGGMLCSIVVNSMFGQLQRAVAETKLSNQQRDFIRAYCEILKEQELTYRRDMEIIFNRFFEEKERDFIIGFNQINDSLEKGEEITQGLNTIADSMGVSLAFESVDEFRGHLKSGKTFHLGE